MFNVLTITISDIASVPITTTNGQPISQWSGQINGFDGNQTQQYMPGYGMGNGGSGNGGNGSNGNNGNGGSGNAGNGMGNGWNNGMGNGWNNGMTNGWNNGSNGWNNGPNGWNNGSNGSGMNGGNGGNGGGMPSNAMADDWSNGFSGMSSSWSNTTNMSFGSIQSQPGAGYPASYYQQYSNQSFVMPTPANVQDFQNTTAPTGMADQMNIGNMGNNYNPSAFQFQGCMPQSDASTMSPVTEGGATTNPITQGSTDTNETSPNSDGTSTVASTRKRNKH